MNQRDEEVLISRTMEVRTYEVISPILEPGDDDEWIVREEGRPETRVVIQDDDFLDDVRNGRVGFIRGCRIECRMQETRWMTREGVRTEYRVREVIQTTNPAANPAGDPDDDYGDYLDFPDYPQHPGDPD